MERIEIFNKLNKIFCEILDLDEVTLTDDTSANDIEEWDSLAQIQLIVAIEKAFSIKLSWKNVGAMIDCILSKL